MRAFTTFTARPGRLAIVLVALVLAFRFWLGVVFPITGDEAYFAVWGQKPAWGFYDHPPMVGWWLALLTPVSMAPWVLRLPSILVPPLLAVAIYLALRSANRDRALYAALAFLLVPVNVWNVFITTDTPLVVFCFLSGLAWWKGKADAGVRWQVWAGIFLGLAFLSKYFSALLALVLIADVLLSPRAQRNWRGLGIAFACALPFGLLNLWWNYENCWANLMFNLYNRHDGAGFSWKSPLLFVLIALYVLSPVALWQLARMERAEWRRKWSDPRLRFLLIAAVLPFLLFALLSLVRQVGLHWVFAFLPFFFMAAASVLTERQLRVSVLYLGAFSLLHVAAALISAALPLETWKNSRYYDGIVFHFRIDEVVSALKTYQPEFELAADGYSPAVTASVRGGSYVFVFGTASSHARHDDLVTDFGRYAHKNILVFRKNPPEDNEYRPYFREVEYGKMKIAGATFYLVFGKDFQFAAYRDGVLAPVRDRYFRIPAFLPQGGCSFCERYFQTACPVRGG